MSSTQKSWSNQENWSKPQKMLLLVACILLISLMIAIISSLNDNGCYKNTGKILHIRTQLIRL